MSGPAWRAWPLALLALGSLAFGVVRARDGRGPFDRSLLVAGAGFLAAATALPLHLPNWEFFSVRFAPIATVLLCLALPVERLPLVGRRAVAVASLVFALAATGWGAVHHRSLFERTAPAHAGLDLDYRTEGTRLAIVLDPFAGRTLDERRADVPYTAPLANLGKLYALAQGGMVPRGFYVDPAIHGVLLTDWGRDHLPASADPRVAIQALDPARGGGAAEREAVATYLASGGTRFDDVVLWGSERDVDHLEWLGYETLWRRGGLGLARFRGCPRSVRFPADAPLAPDDRLEVGWYPALETTHTYGLGAVAVEPDGARVLRMRQSCGALWVRLADAGRACAGADAEGRLLLPPGPEASVECRPAPRVRGGQR